MGPVWQTSNQTLLVPVWGTEHWSQHLQVSKSVFSCLKWSSHPVCTQPVWFRLIFRLATLKQAVFSAVVTDSDSWGLPQGWDEGGQCPVCSKRRFEASCWSHGHDDSSPPRHGLHPRDETGLEDGWMDCQMLFEQNEQKENSWKVMVVDWYYCCINVIIFYKIIFVFHSLQLCDRGLIWWLNFLYPSIHFLRLIRSQATEATV